MTAKRLSLKALLCAAAAVGVLGMGIGSSHAADKVVKVGITLPLTGADAQSATLIKQGAELGIEDANKGLHGYKLEAVVYDDGTATAGQYDPAQAATNTKKLVADPLVIANIGPQMSGSGKAMSPILSAANLATITPSSTNPDITSPDPKFVAQFRPNKKAVYFRTVTTDAYQGPNMANFFHNTLHVKSVYILDDSGAYGVGMADKFEEQAKKLGMKVLGRDQLNPKEADYTAILTKIKQANPDALYYGGVAQAGVKVVKQSYDIIPKMIKGGGDGMYGPEYLKGAGFPAAEGWYATIASPHLLADPGAQDVIQRYKKKFGTPPDDYAITAYDAALVIGDAVKRVAESGKEVNRSNVRDAIQATHLKTLQGEISFDENGDLVNKVVSVFQIHKDDSHPLDDVEFQYKYVGVAPASS